jgi:DHA1 family bicyclomycin/chloramphenicol resistance-like MFS transporter
MVANVGKIFGHPKSRFYLLLSGITLSMMLIILINISAIYQANFGISGIWFATMFASQGFGIIIGQMINRRLIESIGIEMSSIIGSCVMVIVAMAIVILSVIGLMNPWLLTGLLLVNAASFLVVHANAVSMTLDPHEKIAGFTSSFYGFFAQIVSSTIGAVLAILINGNLIIWSSFLLFFATVTFTALMWSHSRTRAQAVWAHRTSIVR